MADQASADEVLRLLSKWFGFPVINPQGIPDTRVPMRFDRVPVARIVDHLLRTAGLNYVMLTDPETLVPTKVLAGPRMASSGGYQEPIRGQAGRPEDLPVLPNMPRPAMYPGSPAGSGVPMPMDMPSYMVTLDGAAPAPQPMQMPLNPIDLGLVTGYPVPQPANPMSPGSMKAPAATDPGAKRPGVVVPVPPPKDAPPGSKPPGRSNQ